MFPPSQGLNLDVAAISGICGSISIACWIVVFSPQIYENFRRGSADGLSLQFIIVWLAGDVFNILGAVLQGVLPTMIILAIYYTIADIVLLLQCFYYRGFTWKDEIKPSKPVSSTGEANERTGLLPSPVDNERERRSSVWSNVDASHLSPVTPLIDPPKPSDPPAIERQKPTTTFQAFMFNLVSVIMVCAAGILGWWLSNRSSPKHHHKAPHHDEDVLQFNILGQVFGYFCALLYLGSRIPQILLNYRRKSTEGVSMLFFLFACIGNLTYVLSIFAYEPHCSGPHNQCAEGEALRNYGMYILVNASWLAGSMGTLFLDAGIFIQFFLYRQQDEDDEEEAVPTENGRTRVSDDRPLLERGDTDYN
ncbi:PQ-loop-domain-containing protein [Coleophoma cylindrospora]|uniref:PQ-loop-domain-containing protein n=1 Tax=Coleophoma cylindrospora TaxID=1849047 RepID=A0A3D8SPI6_9HELO|nr:PQ-loop-domain-containing protein [Coleophoma cylindrospora]